MKITIIALVLSMMPLAAHPQGTDDHDRLLETLTRALECEVITDYVKVALSEERVRLRRVWSRAGWELGNAMLRGEFIKQDGAHLLRCMRKFQLPVDKDADKLHAAFEIGFQLGERRSCMLEVFTHELLRAVPTGPLLGGNSKQARDDRERTQQYALDRFSERNCSFVSLPR